VSWVTASKIGGGSRKTAADSGENLPLRGVGKRVDFRSGGGVAKTGKLLTFPAPPGKMNAFFQVVIPSGVSRAKKKAQNAAGKRVSFSTKGKDGGAVGFEGFT